MFKCCKWMIHSLVTKLTQFYKTTITFVEVVWENKIKVQSLFFIKMLYYNRFIT